MSTRRGLLTLFLSCCVAVPVIIGASCPPPTNPLVTAIVSDNTTLSEVQVPACIEGFVCINLANGASVTVNMALYTDDGYDTGDDYGPGDSFQCCTNPNSPTACHCFCPGRDTGDCLLTRPEIFLPVNLTPVSGFQAVGLAPNASILTRMRCGDVKNIGASVAQSPEDPITAPADQNGPVYRDEPGGVPCGQTVQFLTTDLSQSGGNVGGNNLVTLVIRTQFSN